MIDREQLDEFLSELDYDKDYYEFRKELRDDKTRYDKTRYYETRDDETQK